MYEAKPSGPKTRVSFMVAFSFGLLLMACALYVRETQHPAPRWAEHAPSAFMSAVLALFILLTPMPGMTRNMAKAIVVIFAAASAVELYSLFF
jgi:hypothetical protein